MKQSDKLALKELQTGLGWFVLAWGLLTVLVIIISKFYPYV